jgi:hypothetical protein
VSFSVVRGTIVDSLLYHHVLCSGKGMKVDSHLLCSVKAMKIGSLAHHVLCSGKGMKLDSHLLCSVKEILFAWLDCVTH